MVRTLLAFAHITMPQTVSGKEGPVLWKKNV